jgi:hypothetical protein
MEPGTPYLSPKSPFLFRGRLALFTGQRQHKLLPIMDTRLVPAAGPPGGRHAELCAEDRVDRGAVDVLIEADDLAVGDLDDVGDRRAHTLPVALPLAT